MSTPMVSLYNEFNNEDVIILKPGKVSLSWLHKTFRFSSYNRVVWLTSLRDKEMVDLDDESIFKLPAGSNFIVSG